MFWFISGAASAQDPEIIPKTAKRKITDFTNELSVGFGAVFFPDVFGPGLRIQYEHFFGKKRKMALLLNGNVAYMQNTFDKVDWYDFYAKEYVMWYFAPGFRFHPIGAQHILDYSFGLSVPLGEVKRNIAYTTPRFPSGNQDQTLHSDNFFYAILLENNLNLRKRGRRFVFGINFGTGLMLDDVNQGELFYQLGVKIGSDLRKLGSGK
jgi:hypothetical protein